MFFEIENTPEHIRKARRRKVTPKNSPKEECPRLILAPFTRPPQVVFENILIGRSCERNLEILNPSKHTQQITLGRALPPGLVIHLPGDWLILEPETCYCLTLIWTPIQPTALRETIRFTDENRGRYDIIVVLKSAMNIKGKSNQPKGFKISPGKMKKKTSKKSPVTLYKKKKLGAICNTTKTKKSVNLVHSTEYKSSNKENISTFHDFSIQSVPIQNNCPFDSPTSVDLNFDTSEIFSNFRRINTENMLHNTYDKCDNLSNKLPVPQNILKPSNKQLSDNSASDIFDNLTFTPLKTLDAKSDKLDKGPKIILSLNSESELDDSLNVKTSNEENENHSIICITSSQPPNKWLNVNHQHNLNLEHQYVEIPAVTNKKIPNTSSPKELSSPNFSINTEFSRISELSFFPQRFSTERKVLPKLNNETQDLVDDLIKVSSDTYTKDSPNTPMDLHISQTHTEAKPHYYFMRENPKMCRQALFREYQQQKEYDKCYIYPYEVNSVWQNDLRPDVKSPPRSLTPPLQSIPEESTQFSDTQMHDKTNKKMDTFTINRTYDKDFEKSFVSTSMKQSWSKKAIRAEPGIWKVPECVPRKSSKPRTSINLKDSLCSKISSTFNKSFSQNVSLNQVGNIYSQAFTVDPFLSSTYFYDEEAVDKFENEFKRWLNYILTPPADLDSNVEQKLDFGKAWIENRNKEIPAAPTKEQVSNVYHNSHRLESVRRAARTLLMCPEISLVFQKLNGQIEKKLIAIRNDRNLHLDVGLQKVIMELLLSYNPLWLRIGLETIYGLVLPLKSNSDIEGLTTFIIQRMFKNPLLKNKHSKNSAPNMLLPAYMEAIKKFTLKKFFKLVFFLDQAKQRKLISHDPCLFCRNAICKESREIIIRFTRELIAGIGDITKHLRPLGYVVVHKQSYLDEYKYAVHNIASDIRDGVRLTKVMEIILMKDGLLNQLRTPAISRLQKIHNVQVALNALKEANFVIVGDITSNDIADGHREKTLSLLWQIIHVFRAPLFQKAANVIQTWWRKKYEVIMEKRKEQQKLQQLQNKAASAIQCWWRRIQHCRLIEWQMQQITTATIILQAYCRMWLCRNKLRKIKSSVLKIENWYRSVKLRKEAKETLTKLILEREKRIHKAAVTIQSYVRRWICMKHYKMNIQKIILLQSIIRCFLVKTRYKRLQKSVIYIQQKYRGKLLMKAESKMFIEKKKSAIIIQSYYRTMKQRRWYQKLRNAVKIIEEKYIALLKMRLEKKKYEELKQTAIFVQARIRGKRCRTNFIKQKNLLLNLQKKIKAHILMKKEHKRFLNLKTATILIQNHFRAYLTMKKAKEMYLLQRNCIILIQKRFRSYQLTKATRNNYLQLRDAAVVLQRRRRSLLTMRQKKYSYLKLKESTIILQRYFRAYIFMKHHKESYDKLRSVTIIVQRRFRAQRKMREEKCKYDKLKSSCRIIQTSYRAYLLGKQQRQLFLKKREAAVVIQTWYKNCLKTKNFKQQFQQSKQACLTIQRIYKAYIIGRKQRQEYIKIKMATLRIQQYYRTYIEMKTVRDQYIQLKTATVAIQRFYKSYLIMKAQRNEYLHVRCATQLIQNYYRNYRQTKTIRQNYCELRKAAVYVQRRYRSICTMRSERNKFLKLKQSTLVLQNKYRALLAMRLQSQSYLNMKSATIIIQTRFRAQRLMQKERKNYVRKLEASTSIQRFFRAYLLGKKYREEYLKLRRFVVIVQNKFKSLLAMKKDRKFFLAMRSAAVIIQGRYRTRLLMMKQKSDFNRCRSACITIQKIFRAYLVGKKQQTEYMKYKSSTIKIQQWYRNIRQSKITRRQYLQLLNTVVFIQRKLRANRAARELCRYKAATKIQFWYIAIRMGIKCRNEYLRLKRNVIILQSVFRMYIHRKRFITKRTAALIIQKCYRSYKLARIERQNYVHIRTSIIKLQAVVRSYIERKRYLRFRRSVITIQTAYRLKREKDNLKKRRETAAICLQKNIRRYIVQSWYRKYKKYINLVQKLWRGKLVTRLMRCEYLQKRMFVIKLQAAIRGYLVRKIIQIKRDDMIKKREEQKRDRAASKIQALFRGHKARLDVSCNKRVAELRRRWRAGALRSTQESLKERNEEAMEVLRNMSDIETVIRAFRSLELLTEVLPMMYNSNASSIVRRVYIYMSVTNRSISSIEVLKSAASVLVNLTRYRITGPKIYARDRIPTILKFMWRFSNSETLLFCILTTYLWLFAKYDAARKDLTEFLHIPENHKMLTTIKGNVERMKRMSSNSRTKMYAPQPCKLNTSRTKLHTSQSSKFVSGGSPLPALEPDYGIMRADKPRYFEDAYQAITCLFHTYNL